MNNLSVGLSTDLYFRDIENDFYNKNRVSHLIREAINEFLLLNGETQSPFSLSDWSGKVVLLKPNWVNHTNFSHTSLDCLITHQLFISTVLQEVIKRRPKRIIIGDAPIQGCLFDEVVTPQFQKELKAQSDSCEIEIVDFRRTLLNQETQINKVITNNRSSKNYLLFDLGSDSLLDSISEPPGRFRVTMYDPRELKKSHHVGKHEYLLCREAFEADLIINLPKLKTHKKAGITGALKNLVGLNGNKDYLPHHRVGGSWFGGDCYPGLAPIKRLIEYCYDESNKNIGRYKNRWWRQLAKSLLKIQKLVGDTNVEGGWYGNDTVWRTVLDLNRIIVYGRIDGTMADTPQREVWSITDAILSGQGNGPLAPIPCKLGAVTFSNSSVAADVVHATLLGMDWHKIPLLLNSFSPFRWPLIPNDTNIKIFNQGREINLADVAKRFGKPAKPPEGWIGYCELKE